MENKIKQLLPCSCGGKARLIDGGARWFKGIGCRKCGLEIYFFHPKGPHKGANVGFWEESPNAIIKAWNKHVSKIVKYIDSYVYSNELN